MNTIHDSNRIPSSEVIEAERQADSSRQQLESSIDRLGSVILGTRADLEHRMDEVAMKVEQKGDVLRHQLDEGVVRIDQMLDQGKVQVDATLSHLDQVVSEVFSDVNGVIERSREPIARVKSLVTEVMEDADHLVGRIEGVISGVRTDFAGASDSILSRAERVTQTFRTHLTTGSTQINEMIGRAEQMLVEISDPVSFVRKNPRLGVSVLLFGGVLIGAFVRNLVSPQERRGVERTHEETHIPIVGSEDYSEAA